MRLSPYQRIVRAAKAGRGVRLSADETFSLAHDDAIATVAAQDDEDPDWAEKIDAPDEEES